MKKAWVAILIVVLSLVAILALANPPEDFATAPSADPTPRDLSGDGARDAELENTTEGRVPVETARRKHRDAHDGFDRAPTTDPSYRASLCTFTGRLVDRETRPLAGIRIEVFDSGEFVGESQTNTETTRSRRDGRFAIAGYWGVGSFLVKLRAGDGSLWRLEKYLPNTATGSTHDLGDLVMESAAGITGLVVDGTGVPIAGARVLVAVYGDDERKEMNARAARLPNYDVDGFRLESSPDSTDLSIGPSRIEFGFDDTRVLETVTGRDGRFSVLGLRAGQVQLCAGMLGRFLTKRQVCFVRPAKVTDVGRIDLSGGRRIAGRVLRSDGLPAGGSRLVLFSGTADGSARGEDYGVFGSHVGVADERGRFDVSGFLGTDFVIAAQGGPCQKWVFAEATAPIDDLEISLGAAFDVEILLLDPKGTRLTSGIAHAKIEVYPEEEDQLGSMFVWMHSRRFVRDGSRLLGLAPGEYWVTASVDGHGYGAMAFEVQDENLELLMRLSRDSQLRVRAVDVTGNPIPNVELGVQSGWFRVRRWTDGEGLASFNVPRIGGMTVRAKHPGFLRTERECKPDVRQLELTLRRPCHVSGRVLFSGASTSMKGWKISLTPIETSTRSEELKVNVLADGRFRADLPHAGPWLVASLTSDEQRPVPFRLPAHAQNVVRVRDGEAVNADVIAEWRALSTVASVRGNVTVNGKSHGGLEVAAKYPWGQHVRTVPVDAEGRFDAGIMSWSEVDIELWSEHILWSQRITLQPGIDRDLDIRAVTGSIEGSISNSSGTPIEKVELLLVRESLGGQIEVSLFRESAAGGGFEFTLVPAGKYRLSASDGAHSRAQSDVVVAGRRAEIVDVQLERTVEVAGVADFSGLGGIAEPQKPSSIIFRGPVTEQVHLDSESSFRTSDLVPGSYTVSVSIDGRDRNVPHEVTIGKDGAPELRLRFVTKE